MEEERSTKFIYVLLMVVCIAYTVDSLTCPAWFRYRYCYNRPCTVVRNGRGGRATYDCLSYEEYRLLMRALYGGATGPGTGIGEQINLSDRLKLHININNTNDNVINQEGSNNVDVSQVQASLSPDQCIRCTNRQCPGQQICVYTSACPGMRTSCRSIVGG